MFAFVFLMPGLQSTLFCLAIGRDPTSLKMAIVNEELNPSIGRVCNYTTDCTYSMFSCRYLRYLDNATIIQVIRGRGQCPKSMVLIKLCLIRRFLIKVYPMRWMQRYKELSGESFTLVQISRRNCWNVKLMAMLLIKKL